MGSYPTPRNIFPTVCTGDHRRVAFMGRAGNGVRLLIGNWIFSGRGLAGVGILLGGGNHYLDPLSKNLTEQNSSATPPRGDSSCPKQSH
jgi:hypothetical protein